MYSVLGLSKILTLIFILENTYFSENTLFIFIFVVVMFMKNWYYMYCLTIYRVQLDNKVCTFSHTSIYQLLLKRLNIDHFLSFDLLRFWDSMTYYKPNFQNPQAHVLKVTREWLDFQAAKKMSL